MKTGLEAKINAQIDTELTTEELNKLFLSVQNKADKFGRS